jgi:hypothetical protein
MAKVLERIQKIMQRYLGFTCLDEYVDFGTMFCNKDYDVVQIHDITPVGDNDIIGFAGIFAWKDNVITSLDGDSYTPHMKICGYKEFEKDKERCLDVLTEEW